MLSCLTFQNFWWQLLPMVSVYDSQVEPGLCCSSSLSCAVEVSRFSVSLSMDARLLWQETGLRALNLDRPENYFGFFVSQIMWS